MSAPLVLAAMVLALVGGTPAAVACTVTTETVAVVRAVPAAHVVILDGGTVVDLVGALPPPGDAATDPAATTREALAALTIGRAADIAVAGRRQDRHGRLLAQVFTGEGAGRVWVQGRLVADGLARAYALPGSIACLGDLVRLEANARADRRGHWATGVFTDREAASPRDIARYEGTFQTVVGRVGAVTAAYDDVVLTVGRMEAVLPSPAGDAPASADGTAREGPPSPPADRRRSRRIVPAELTALTGTEVRVRGWIERSRGGVLRVRLTDPGDIEQLGG